MIRHTHTLPNHAKGGAGGRGTNKGCPCAAVESKIAKLSLKIPKLRHRVACHANHALPSLGEEGRACTCPRVGKGAASSGSQTCNPPPSKLTRKSQQIGGTNWRTDFLTKQLPTDLDRSSRPQTHLPFGCCAIRAMWKLKVPLKFRKINSPLGLYMVLEQLHIWHSQYPGGGGATTTGPDATPPPLSAKTCGGGELGRGGGGSWGGGGVGGTNGSNWGGGVSLPSPTCCDEASQYASQKNPVTD